MIFLQLWWALMVFSGSGSSQQMQNAEEKPPVEGSDKLLSFSRAVEQARPELQELKASYGGLQEQDNQKLQPRDRRNSIDDMLANFAQVQDGESKATSADEERVLQEAADAWFRDIQASMSRGSANQKRSGGGKQERSVAKNVIDQHTKALERTEMGKVKLKYKEMPDDTIVRKYQVTKPPERPQDGGLTHLDIKLKQVQQMLSDQEGLEAKKREKSKDVHKKVDESGWVDKLPEFGDNPIPDGIYESTLNRLAFPHATANKLAHEANYKLSKIEQEASEKATKYSRPESTPLRPIKRSSCSGFNPMNEIKLKTSSRLMLKGLGPSLPSNALMDIHRNQMVDNMLRRRELEDQQQQQQKFESSQGTDEEDMPMGINGNLEYLQQPSNPIIEANPMMELPQSYDYRVPQYDRFHPLSQRQMTNVRDYERSNRMPLDLDRFKREPQDESILEPLKTEDQNISDHEMAVKLGILDIKEGNAIHSVGEHEAKEKDSDDENKLEDLHDEVKLEEDALVKPEDKLDPGVSSMEGGLGDKSEAEVESKVLGPVKREIKPSIKMEASLKDDTTSAMEPKLKPESPSKRELPLTLDTSELHSKVDAEMAPSFKAHDTLEKRDSPETPDNPDNHDSSADCDAECKSEDVEKTEDDGIVKVNIKLKLQEPAEEKPECEDCDKLEPKEAAAAASVPKVNPDAVVKLLANELSLDKERGKRQTRLRRLRRQNHRAKRSLEDNEKDLQKQPEEDQRSQGDQHVVAKRLVHLLDDFEDHNGNRVAFGNLGNGMHESLAHFEDLDSLANIYDPTKEVVPMINQRQQQQVLFPQQQQMQQQQSPPLQAAQQLEQNQQQPQQDLNRQRHQSSSNFQASFNLTHFFNELQKLQNIKTPQQQQQQQQPLPVQQQYMPQQQPLQQTLQMPQQQLPMQRVNQQLPIKPVSPPIKSFGVHRYFGPFFNKQLKNDPYLAVMATSTTIDPRCVSITNTQVTPPAGNVSTAATLPPNCTTSTGSSNPVATTSAPPAPSHTENVCNAPDAMKLNVSINANVCGDPKTKQFYGNGSISLLPAYQRFRPASNSDIQDVQLHNPDDPKARDERRIREVGEESKDNREDEKTKKQEGHLKRPSIKWTRKNQSKTTAQQAEKVKPKVTSNIAPKEVTKVDSNEPFKIAGKCHRPRIDTPESRSDSYDKLITGKMSEDIVSAVFEAVGNDPGMDRLLAVLERNRKCAHQQPKNFYQIRNDKTENYLYHTETMVRDTMEAISNIIDQQVRRRACIPLRPDLQEFYDLILKTSSEEQKCREKRQSSLRVLAEDFSQDVRLLDPSKINQKSRIVKKLLRQYEDLPMEDQQAAVGVRDELLLDLVYLRKMADSAERHQRNARLQEVLKQTSLDEGLEKRMSSEYSPRFIKLLKTAELFKEAGEQQARAFVGI
nr:formin-J [Drosophila takahashii]